jgi:hypothetical protein
MFYRFLDHLKLLQSQYLCDLVKNHLQFFKEKYVLIQVCYLVTRKE